MIGAVVRCAARRLTRMRIAFLTGIWPPDVGGPATHGPDFARFLVARGHSVRVVTMGDGEPAERPCEVEVVSRRLPFPLRYGQVALRGAQGGPRGRRRLRDGDVRRCGSRRDRRAAPARREARLRPRLRARAPLPPVRGHARGVPGRGERAGTRAQGGSDARPPDGDDDRRPERVPRRDRAGVGPLGRTDPRPHEPRAAAHRGRARAARARAPSSSSAGSRARRPSALRSRPSPACRPQSSSSSETAPSGPSSSAWRRPPRARRGCASSACEPVTRRCASSPAPKPASSRVTGRTCRTPRWRRCPSACPSSRRPSAECRRS